MGVAVGNMIEPFVNKEFHMEMSDPNSSLEVLSLNNLTSAFKKKLTKLTDLIVLLLIFFSFCGLLHRPMHSRDGNNLTRIEIELKQITFMNQLSFLYF